MGCSLSACLQWFLLPAAASVFPSKKCGGHKNGWGVVCCSFSILDIELRVRGKVTEIFHAPSEKLMSLSRILLCSSRNRASDVPRLLQRCRKAQYCNYSKSSRYSHEELTKRITAMKTESTHSWHNYIIPTLVVGTFAGFAIFVHYNDERRAILRGQGTGNQLNARIGPVIGGPFTLINTELQVVTEKNFLSNWVILYFGYTSSPDVGPEQLKTMAKAIDLLEAKQVKILPVFVSIDPQRDNPSHLRAYLKEFNSRIMGLMGPVRAIRQMAQEYRIYFRKVEEEEGDDYLVESSHNMYLLNPTMEVVRCFGTEYGADELFEEILKELKKSAS
ncbi:hypothetical protein SAY86_010023 [Trapa natans]|uniref:Protein SCO1 homolog 2, mitochondrial n=1 Tax=Trapa natans TaxID=22666 RepID=A0AAN7L2S6_TRANT|nr:hypothetical protein SAY86_010023 [Trapa natans]